MAKIIIPVISFLMTIGFMSSFGFMLKKLTPVFAAVRK